jgi:hypothetical protein
MENSNFNWNLNSVCIVTYRWNNYKLAFETPALKHTWPLFSKPTVLLHFHVIVDQFNRKFAWYR